MDCLMADVLSASRAPPARHLVIIAVVDGGRCPRVVEDVEGGELVVAILLRPGCRRRVVDGCHGPLGAGVVSGGSSVVVGLLAFLLRPSRLRACVKVHAIGSSLMTSFSWCLVVVASRCGL
eukprot:5041832-Amphidinium_carterae.1